MSNEPEPMQLARLMRHGRKFWASDAGQAMRRAERACLGPLGERWFGAHGLEMSLGDPLVADMCHIRHLMRWAPTRELAESSSTLVCPSESLPLPAGVLDLVVLHHMLEVVQNPHQLLQEAARVTAAQGRLIIVGWSPVSAAGMMRLGPGHRQRLPGQGHWRTAGRLKDWLEFVEFEIERLDYCGFHLPGMAPRNALLETLGRRHNLPLGDGYIIQARCRSQLACHQTKRPLFGTPLGTSSLGATRLDPNPKAHAKHKVTTR
ncbi:class I SAM-dependent methyltransferase [Halomonas sp. V046]|uniref:class I SAM-dependent methyltransferase n=1 Tax=Halomonas sp. V046 TaxID=3459611 RepID=UPI004044A05D